MQPPKLPLKLFRFYCSEERREELEGDLYEVFQERVTEKGTRFAKLFYWWLVIRSFRSFALKRTKMKNANNLFSAATWAHNFKIAWRSIIRRKTTTSINVIGLAIGIAGFISIYNLVAYELSFNKHLPERERVYRIYTEFGGAFTGTNPAVATPVPSYLKENAPIIENIARVYTYRTKSKLINEIGQIESFDWNDMVALVEPSYFDVIDQYVWLAGSPTALSEPFQVVLSKEIAKKYFGNLKPMEVIGKQVTYQDSLDLKVAGVFTTNSGNSDFNFNELISFKTVDKSWLKNDFGNQDWNSVNSSWQVFIKVKPKTAQDQIDEMLDLITKEVASHEEDPETWQTFIRAQPLEAIHYDGSIGLFNNGGQPANMKTLKILFAVACALLLIAIFNFINLETAQAVNKSKEVGLRKSLGVSRIALVARFITESTLLAFLSAVVALPLTTLALDYFGELLPPNFGLNYQSPAFWISLVSVVMAVGILSGLYPALVASSFSPANALKSTLRFNSGQKNHHLLRKVLITSQFVFSQILVICTLGVLLQISYVLSKDMGFKDEGIIYFQTPHYESKEKQQRLLNEISKLPQVQMLSQHESPPARGGWSTSTMKYYDSDSSEVVHSVHQKKGDEQYLDLYELKLAAGRAIRKDAAAKETLINETYAKTLGFEPVDGAIGVQVSNGDDIYNVVGILKDFHLQSLQWDIEPLMYTYSTKYARCIGMAVNTSDIPKNIDKLTDLWSELYPNEALEVRFIDETIENFYKQEKRTSRIAGIATIIAILISSLGLFGLISYNIVQKSKEIGVRKVLGASVLNLSAVLSKEFLLLILIGFVMTVPFAYFLLNWWLEGFSYQANITWWVYALGGVISLAIALLSISMKVWKATTNNPVDSLRYE